MSYLVLARKFRPQTFDEVVAQQHVTDTISNAIEKERLAHAYLFCGPRGTGKTTTARILAKCLNCTSFDKPTIQPCGKCDSCVTIAAGNSADVLEIDGASNRGIAEIQSLRESVQYAPQGRYKVYIIDEVHMLTKEAFNALLKTLEEPPSHVTFIFATTEPQKLPATIISRCQRYDFRRIPASQIAMQISALAEKEGLSLSDEAAALIAHRADGGLRDSLSLLDQILAYSPKGSLSTDEAARILGILPLDAFDQIAEKIADRDAAGAIIELDRLLESGIDIAQVAEGLIEHFHGALMTSIGAPPDGIGEKEAAIYKKIAEALPPEDLLRIAKLNSELRVKLKSATQPRYLFEEMLVYLSNMDSTVSIRQAITRAPNSGTSAPQRPKAMQTSQRDDLEEESEESEIDDATDKGRLVKEFAAKHGESKADWVREAELIIDEKRIVLKFPHRLEFQVSNILMRRDNVDALREAAGIVFGEKMEVKLLIEDAPEDANPADKSEKPGKQIPENVKLILDAFDAKLE